MGKAPGTHSRIFPAKTLYSWKFNCPVKVPPENEPNEIDNHSVDANENDVEDTRPSVVPLDLQIGYECAQVLEVNCPRNWSSNNFRIDLYFKAVEIIQRHIHQWFNFRRFFCLLLSI